MKTGKILVTIAVILTAIVSTVVDNLPGGHMNDPLWVPHAKFHDAAMFMLLDGVCLLALWLLWRRSTEPLIGVVTAIGVVVAFWLPFLYITTLYPQASLLLDSPLGQPWHRENFAQWSAFDRANTYLLFGSIPMYINAVTGVVLMVMATLGGWLYWRNSRENSRSIRYSTRAVNADQENSR